VTSHPDEDPLANSISPDGTISSPISPIGEVDRTATPNDTDLVQGTKAGDTTAFETLWQRYHFPIYKFCWRMLRNREDAEDAAAEAFARALMQLVKLRQPAQFKSWLYRIALNVCRDEMKGRLKTVSPAEDLPELATDVKLPDPLKSLQHEELRTAIAKLSPKLREALILVHFEGLAYSEATEVLKCGVNTVKTRVHRAIEELGKMLCSSYVRGRD
jgi:RNA polymerase sigma-70 factor, ECF subfamily